MVWPIGHLGVCATFVDLLVAMRVLVVVQIDWWGPRRQLMTSLVQLTYWR